MTIPLYSLTTNKPAKNVLLTIEDSKFAQMAAAAASDVLLDDETSPTDSLVSSCTDTDELMQKKNKPKNVTVATTELVESTEDGFNASSDSHKEKEIDEISPDLCDMTSPLSPGTPTHASNSFSLSDNGRDFLIDDEIADQPELVFDDGDNKESTNNNNNSLHLHSMTDTPTLMEIGSMKSSIGLPPRSAHHSKLNKLTNGGSGGGTASPMNTSFIQSIKGQSSINGSVGGKNGITRTESLDTLSPCESIASDDMMLDFECHSSMDSIDSRMQQRSNASGSGSALHSMDETQLWSEIEAQGGDIAREWSSLLRGQKQSSRESIT